MKEGENESGGGFYLIFSREVITILSVQEVRWIMESARWKSHPHFFVQRNTPMKSVFSNIFFPTLWTLRIMGSICLISFFQSTQAQPISEPTPSVQYGLGRLRCAAYSQSPDLPLIATGGGAGAVIWNATTGEQVRILSASGHGVRSVAFSHAGGHLLTGGDDGIARIWDIFTGESIMSVQGGVEIIDSVSFSPDDTHILTAGVESTTNLQPIKTLERRNGRNDPRHIRVYGPSHRV